VFSMDITALFSGRTSGIPTLGCPTGRLDAFSTNARCSGSGRRAEIGRESNEDQQLGQVIRRFTLQTPQATVHSSLVALA
jgi:phosphoribosyl 1,2-cyclic phosphodiesterase